jgi:hypothetical protein
MGQKCPEWAMPKVQYQLVLDQEHSNPNPPSHYFTYPVYALVHNNIASSYESVCRSVRLHQSELFRTGITRLPRSTTSRRSTS